MFSLVSFYFHFFVFRFAFGSFWFFFFSFAAHCFKHNKRYLSFSVTFSNRRLLRHISWQQSVQKSFSKEKTHAKSKAERWILTASNKNSTRFLGFRLLLFSDAERERKRAKRIKWQTEFSWKFTIFSFRFLFFCFHFVALRLLVAIDDVLLQRWKQLKSMAALRRYHRSFYFAAIHAKLLSVTSKL